MRRPVIAGNWKLHKNLAETSELIAALKTGCTDVEDVEILVAPVYTALTTAVAAAAGSKIAVAGQNCHYENSGAFTGEVAPAMLKDVGCSHVILGHSERRQLFGESDELINVKAKAALAAGLVVIFCVGETLTEREDEQMYDVLTRQLARGLEGMTSTQLEQLIIAYEPVWAIGTGKVATNDQAEEAHSFLRGLVAGQFDKPCSESIRILYGGSVKPDNVDGLMAQQNIDGTLVGGASLKPDDFLRIIHFRR
jgi:triosephosphate isomerase (TIM)